MVVGKSSNSLESTGSYWYLHERFAANGVGDVALRVMKHTPELSVPLVYSEPTECKDHGYTFEQLPYSAQRVMTSPGGPSMDLFMNASLLGWLKVRPVVNPQRVKKYLELLQAGSLQLMTASSTALEGYTSALQLIGSLDAQGDALFMTENSSTLFVLSDGHTTTAELGAQDTHQVKGVALLRRQRPLLTARRPASLRSLLAAEVAPRSRKVRRSACPHRQPC